MSKKAMEELRGRALAQLVANPTVLTAVATDAKTLPLRDGVPVVLVAIASAVSMQSIVLAMDEAEYDGEAFLRLMDCTAPEVTAMDRARQASLTAPR